MRTARRLRPILAGGACGAFDESLCGRRSEEVWAYVSGVVWLAASLQGTTGFGFMMLCLPMLVLFFPAQIVVPGVILIYLPLGTAQSIQSRRDIHWPTLVQMASGAVLTLPLGAWILRDADTLAMQRGIGALLMGLALLLQANPGRPFRREGLARVGAGVLSGLLASSTAVSGPPVVLLGLKQRWQARRFRATLLSYFLVVSLACLPFHWRMSLLNTDSLTLALAGTPGMVLGFLTATWLRGRVRGGTFRWLAVGLVMAGGTAAILF